MSVKTFTGSTIAEALTEVKKDLGRDAVILHTRSYKIGAVLGMGGRDVVEITAADSSIARGPRLRPSPGEPANAGPTTAEQGFVPARFPVYKSPDAQPAPQPPAAPPLIEQPTPPPARKRLATTVELKPQDDAAMASIKGELASIKGLIGQMMDVTRRAPGVATGVLHSGGLHPTLLDLLALLHDAGFSSDWADSIVAEIRHSLTPAEVEDPQIVRHAALRTLASRISVVGSPARAGRQADGRPLTIALVGPTGVGKTTTIAKLAASYKLRQGKRVGLITSDTYRIAAVEQLRTYATIIGLPLRVVLTPKEVASARDDLADNDVIILDTPGRSQRDIRRVEELREAVAAASPHEVHMVVSAAAAPRASASAIERFRSLSPSSLILSKLDESVAPGAIVEMVASSNLPLSYLTTGQEVPDDFEPADAQALARRVLCPPEEDPTVT